MSVFITVIIVIINILMTITNLIFWPFRLLFEALGFWWSAALVAALVVISWTCIGVLTVWEWIVGKLSGDS